MATERAKAALFYFFSLMMVKCQRGMTDDFDGTVAKCGAIVDDISPPCTHPPLTSKDSKDVDPPRTSMHACSRPTELCGGELLDKIIVCVCVPVCAYTRDCVRVFHNLAGWRSGRSSVF